MPRRPPKTCKHEDCTILTLGSDYCGKHRLESSTSTRVVLMQEENQ